MPLVNMEADVYGRLIDVTTGEAYKFDWNPSEINEEVKVNFSRQKIPGLSHGRTQFLNTDNREISFTLVVDGLVHGGPAAVEKARQFLLSTMYPRSSRRLEGAGPPRMLLLIPGTFRTKGFIESVKIKQVLFYRDMKLRKFEADIKFVEEPELRVTSQEVRSRKISSREIGSFLDFRNVPPFVVKRPKKGGFDFSNATPFRVGRK